MPHPSEKDARRSFGDKLDAIAGKRGEFPMDKAARMAGPKSTASAQGDAAAAPEEKFIKAPSRQISNYGTVKGK
jgi:hypothetical protein